MDQILLEGSEPEGLIGKLASNPDLKAGVQNLFVTTLGREPSEPELDAVLEYAQKRLAKESAAEPITVWRNIAWALIASAEFRFNH